MKNQKEKLRINPIYYHNEKNKIGIVGQMVKRRPTMRETRVQFLGQEVPLEKGMATHSSILAWRIPWTEKPGHGVAKSQTRLSD